MRRSGESADDVRILSRDGARNLDLFNEVAGLLRHDVLVSPDGSEIRHRGNAEAGPLHAVPLDRVTRRPMDWIVVQPPDLATPLPGWFAVHRGWSVPGPVWSASHCRPGSPSPPGPTS
ncbi:hypothetical protein NKG94_02675 [Micromonospora sp. M12]